jgi:hypothetical protein
MSGKFSRGEIIEVPAKFRRNVIQALDAGWQRILNLAR